MNRARLVGHGLRSMGRYKLRSFFVGVGALLGTAALTFVFAVGRGAEQKMLATVRHLFGASAIQVLSGGTRLLGGPHGAEADRLTLDDLEAVAARVPGVRAWDPQQGIPETSVRSGGATATTRVLGQSERWSEVWGRGVTRGAPFDLADVRASARVALVGETTARELFGDADPLGAEIQLGSVLFRVVGILERMGTDAHGMDRDDEIVVPITTLMRRVANVDTIAGAKLLARDPAQVEATAEAVRAVLRERHHLPADRPDDFTLITAVQVQRMVELTQRVLDLYLPLGAGIVLAVAAIVTSALMLASVAERVNEIGLRRAVGARVGAVQLQFLVETAVTVVAGGLPGIVVGELLAATVARRLELDGVPYAGAALLGLAITVAVGLIAGLAPARRAARLDPVEALR